MMWTSENKVAKLCIYRSSAPSTSPVECPICMESISEHDKTTLKCGHSFHLLCIQRWCNTKNGEGNCPYCRADGACTDLPEFQVARVTVRSSHKDELKIIKFEFKTNNGRDMRTEEQVNIVWGIAARIPGVEQSSGRFFRVNNVHLPMAMKRVEEYMVENGWEKQGTSTSPSFPETTTHIFHKSPVNPEHYQRSY